MHFEILVEDPSGKKMLDILVPKIIEDCHTYRVTHYKGIGRIPKDLGGTTDPSKRVLLNQLPRVIRGFGKTYPKGRSNYPAAIIVVCDLDNKCLKAFREELNNILSQCSPQPETRFCIAIEEGEAWLLGDIPAIKTAYPRADDHLLNAYKNDSICGTWEYLKRAIKATTTSKGEWAEKITPHMRVEQNHSPSFCYFRKKLSELAVIS